MKKVVFILGDASECGGIEKVTLNLSDELNKFISTKVISLYKKNKEVAFKVVDLPIDYLNNTYEISMYNRPYGLLRGLIFDFIYIYKKSKQINDVFRSNTPDYIVVPDIKTLALAMVLRSTKKSDIIAIEHFEYDVPNFFLRMLRRFLYKSSRVKVVTQTNEDFSKYSWLPKGKVNVIPNMYSISDVKSNVKIKRIIAIGRYCEQKGFDLLINAWRNIPETQREGWLLEIYGQGEDKEKLEKIIENHKVASVSLKPFTNNIDEIYSSSEIFVLSSRYEGLGMVLIEALAHKLPCISFSCPAGPKTIIKHNYNGMLVEPGNIVELSNSMSYLMNSPESRALFSSNSISSIEKFSQKSVSSQWLDLINE
ncbi:glycosyltransferase family 4 protein [Vibrio sp. 10N.286.48.C11]|uniref:glycosyltransferase family 4 protein n=1 Tax=Vibrio sp. 10N.286.48.C11 TaxID=3229698 RepID=UPI003553D5AD